MNKTFIFLGLCAVVFMSGCSSAPKVTRIDTNKVVDLSGKWNDSDAMIVSKNLINDCLTRPWLPEFVGKHDRKPVVIVSNIANRSHEHINSEVITKHLERELLNSGRVSFVASPEERILVRDERANQHEGHTLPETIKAYGKEVGADYILIGSIQSVKDEIKGKHVILYQVNLELVDLESNLKVWLGQKELKKIVKKRKFSL